jgi:hypothetical protein
MFTDLQLYNCNSYQLLSAVTVNQILQILDSNLMKRIIDRHTEDLETIQTIEQPHQLQ